MNLSTFHTHIRSSRESHQQKNESLACGQYNQHNPCRPLIILLNCVDTFTQEDSPSHYLHEFDSCWALSKLQDARWIFFSGYWHGIYLMLDLMASSSFARINTMNGSPVLFKILYDMSWTWRGQKIHVKDSSDGQSGGIDTLHWRWKDFSIFWLSNIIGIV